MCLGAGWRAQRCSGSRWPASPQLVLTLCTHLPLHPQFMAAHPEMDFSGAKIDLSGGGGGGGGLAGLPAM